MSTQLTLSWKTLRAMHACDGAIRRFRFTFGDGDVAVTDDAIAKYVEDHTSDVAIGDIRWYAYEMQSTRYSHSRRETFLWYKLWDDLITTMHKDECIDKAQAALKELTTQ